MRSRETDILIIPGLGGSGPEHWQSRWQAKLPTARRVEQASWDRPETAAWTAAILEAIAACERPVVAVAHSLGVIAFVEAMRDLQGTPVLGAFLVAAPDPVTVAAIPEVDAAFLPYPSAPLPCPSILVASRNDPYGSFAFAEDVALDWGARLVDAGEAGHINSDSGHGPWPEGLMTFAGFLGKL